MMVSAVFENILYIKGYWLNVSSCSKHSLPLKLKKSAARSCWGLSGISLGSMG